MLTEADLALIKDTRKETNAQRLRPVTVIYTQGTRDEWTGEFIDEEEVPRLIDAVVTEVSSMSTAGADRYIALGIKYEKGDIWLSVDIDLIEDIADEIDRLTYDDKLYTILACDKKGLGLRNRYEILARRTS